MKLLDRDKVSISEINPYLLRYKDHMCFAISRNPYLRILSAYKDKLNRLVKKTMPSLYVYSVLRQILEGPMSWKNNKPALAYMRSILPFSEFIDRLSGIGLGIDTHYELQYNAMRPDILATAKFFQLESLASGCLRDEVNAHIASNLELNKFNIPPLPDFNSTGSKSNISQDYDEITMNIVASLYRLDFNAFGYSSLSLPAE